ncbi:MAG: hypothetical protein H7062_01740 [Candidatus Saccharimonas sp.]|nr:hypothetical protein [Planctomycetaceae bacterium]
MNRTCRRARVVTAWLVSLSLFSSLSAEDKPNPKTDAKSVAEKLAARRLEFMKNSVKAYEFLLGPDFTAKLTVEPEPLLRFTNPVSGLQDGGFFLWRSEAGRPMVGAQVFLTSEDLWIHEFQSLAPVPFRVSRSDKITWEPQRAGVEVKPVPDAPVPAAGAVQRLVQMRDIAKRFIASDEFEGRPKSDELRLLTRPLVRFGVENSDTLDGALFVHAHGTDPELMIVLEALKSDSGHCWHYSLAPMTGYALKASLDDKPVWEVAWRKPPYDPKEPFFIRVHSRELSLKKLFPSSK